MPIGELSRLSGVNIETIRYYERIKMLPAPQRTASSRRVYGVTDLRMLAFIRRSRELGFSLNEIRALNKAPHPILPRITRETHTKRGGFTQSGSNSVVPVMSAA